MKKIVLVCLLLTGINHHSNAQLHYGVKAGINYNSDSFEDASDDVLDGAKTKTGFHTGIWFRAKLPAIGFYLRPEIVYTELKNSLNYDSPFAPPREADFKFRKIDVPVLIGKKILGIGNVFAGPSFQYILASDMLKVTFPYLFFIALTAMAAGIFNTFDKFLLPAITPVLLNVSLIFSALYLTNIFSTPIMALAYGVLIAGLLQYIIQIPFLYKLDLLVAPKISFRFSGVNKVIKLMLPAILGTAIVQINLIIDSVVASLLASGSISWLYYSDRLVELPLGVFGIAIATVILPALSAKYSKKDMAAYKSTLGNALNIAVVFSLPAMFGLVILSNHIIISLFQYGSFTINDTLMSSMSLVAYSIGLPAFILMKVLLTGFFSRQDTKTPVRYGIIAVAFNVVMNLSVLAYYLHNPFNGAHAFLALATSLSAWLQVFLLYKNLRQNDYISKSIFKTKPSYQSLLSCIIMTIILSYTLLDVLEWSQNAYYVRGALLLIYIIMGAIIYTSTMYILGYKIKKNYI